MTEPTHWVTISRYVAAPVELVYQAFVDPDQLAQWFGPLQFHVPRDTVAVDARPGGQWRMTMVHNDRPEWASPVAATLAEVVENRLLVGYEVVQGFPDVPDGTKITLSVEFSREGEGTRIELRQGPFPEQLRELSRVGWDQSMYKLAALLATSCPVPDGKNLRPTVTPFLWFDDNAGAALERYLTVFPDAELLGRVAGPDGGVFMATIRLQGQELILMNGGPDHRLTEAFSLSVGVQTQEQVDAISEGLIAGGGTQGRCGWLVDAFGLSWQVVPSALGALMGDPDPIRAGRVRDAMMGMDRLSVKGLQDAYDGAVTG